MHLQQLLHSGGTEGAVEVGVQLHLRQGSAELKGRRGAHPSLAKVDNPLNSELAQEIKKYKRGNSRPPKFEV